MDDKISRLRGRIDEIDETLLELLNERAGIARKVGEEKKTGVIYRPEREAQVHRRLHSKNLGPLSNESVSHLFTEIISACRAQEERLSIACLGPAGTFSEEASFRQFGRHIDLVYCSSIDEVFRVVSARKVSYGVVPLENSTEGAISQTLDLLSVSTLSICGEVGLRVQHNLMAKEDKPQYRKIYSHAQSLGQCQKWLSKRQAQAELIPVSSNAEAARMVAKDADSAAIAGRYAAHHYELSIIEESIEDNPNNTTRFGVISGEGVAASGLDKTSILLASKHEPGAIFELLEPLARNQISMTRLESRPSKQGLWEYMFFIDIEGHQDDAIISRALDEISAKAGLFKILGSYPKST